MQPSERFQKLIDHVSRAEDIEASKKRHICTSLDYFRKQLLTDFDRRDSGEKILTAWRDFQSIMRGSRVLASFEKDQLFWRELQASVGVPVPPAPAFQVVPPRPIKAEEFFIEVASEVNSKMADGPEKMLLLCGLWYLQVEARLARPFRSQSRIELVYRYLHPRLKTKGFLRKFEGNKEVESVVRYFIKGSIY
ncbi:hypothetical protein [Bdellovibrio sp. HCB209]|uniref:hypothetical protein n=1 Tax=Bdellovibrio sp. HCB209 TaxID=3394354 RepID=UPI0039B3B1AB